MRCAKCDKDNPADASFCEECGAKLELLCPACKSSVGPGARFCKKCGTALGVSTVTASAKQSNGSPIRVAEMPAPENIEGERKTVTALFADIKGSTALMEGLDPEAAHAIVEPVLRLMIEAVHRYEGYVARSTGDGIFALFGAPVAHEDHPQRALYAALRLQEELKRYATKLREAGELPIEARVGVNTGEVVAYSVETDGKVEYRLVGHTANLAARMEALAPTGSIAISEDTRRLVEGYFALKALGPTRVKGVNESVNVYEVTGLGPLRTRLQRSVGRGLTKFVGRDREMETLKHAAERAKSGHGQIAAAMAEPGVGKSRLFFEFKATSQSGWMVLETFSVSHGKASAYLPVIDLLRNYFEITPADDERKRREKVAGRIAILDRSLEDTLPYLFSLLGVVEGADPLAQMDGQIKKRRTLEAIKRILLRESLNQPLMVIFEDLHWIDEQTQELLNLLVDSIGTAKILLLVNYRPEYSHHWGGKTFYTQLRLDPLGKESAEEMLSALLGDGRDLIPLKRLIIERTEGTPFFMEEIVQSLFEDGVLHRNGAVKLAKSMNAVKVPTTVQAMLAARIDRLPAEEKELLQVLAVIGREFARSLVSSVVERSKDEDLERRLASLQVAEFIYEQPATGDIEYIFKHALTQEVAYNSLLIERRKQLHERAGLALESLFAGQLEDHLAALAHHYSRSDNLEKAVEYLGRAGQQALQRSAYADATRASTTALELLMRLREGPERDQRELGLQTTLGSALMITKGWAAPETDRVFLRARELAETGGTAAQRFSLLVGLFGTAYVAGSLNEARDRSEPLRIFVRQHPEPEFVLELLHHDWSFALSAGELETALRYVEEGLSFYQAHPGSVPVTPYSAHHAAVCGHAWGAIIFWLRGYPESARRHANQSVSLADEVGHSPSVIFALGSKANVHQIAREFGPALESAEASITLGEKVGVPLFESWARVTRGWALAHLGQAEQGVVQIREGLALATAQGTELQRPYNLAQLGEACGKAGHIDEALEVIAEALDLVREKGERWWEAEILRLRGDLMLKRNPTLQAEAQTAFEQAIDIALKQGAKSLELRATTSLARLLASQGRRDEARTMLAEIYNWFTEGFDTVDLKDAKALLDELS
jgi:class 3 adenylate cyclase/predicted ATPase